MSSAQKIWKFGYLKYKLKYLNQLFNLSFYSQASKNRKGFQFYSLFYEKKFFKTVENFYIIKKVTTEIFTIIKNTGYRRIMDKPEFSNVKRVITERNSVTQLKIWNCDFGILSYPFDGHTMKFHGIVMRVRLLCTKAWLDVKDKLCEKANSTEPTVKLASLASREKQLLFRIPSGKLWVAQ